MWSKHQFKGKSKDNTRRTKKGMILKICPLCDTGSTRLTRHDYCDCIIDKIDKTVIVDGVETAFVKINTSKSHKELQQQYYEILKKKRLLPKLNTAKPKSKGPIIRPATRSERKSFYNSKEWRAIRIEVFYRYGKNCLACGAGGEMHIDHIKPLSKRWDLRLSMENLQVLCKECNLGKSNGSEYDFRPKKGNPRRK